MPTFSVSPELLSFSVCGHMYSSGHPHAFTGIKANSSNLTHSFADVRTCFFRIPV